MDQPKLAWLGTDTAIASIYYSTDPVAKISSTHSKTHASVGNFGVRAISRARNYGESSSFSNISL